MNQKIFIPAVFAFFCLMSAMQCDDCVNQDQKLGSAVSWFPLRGEQLVGFLDNAGTQTDFSLSVIDTSQTIGGYNCSGEVGKRYYLNTTLYLNQNKTDSIHFNLNADNYLAVMASSNDSSDIVMANIFNQKREVQTIKRLYNYVVGSTKYQELILITQRKHTPNTIDSIYIANRTGIVGFDYSAKKYALQ